MTSTISKPTTAAEPVCQTFTVGTLTIEAADEAEALRKYQRLVRAEALKAKADMNWCEDGTNQRLRILGLRDVRAGVPLRVQVTATRTAYINVDAEDNAEAVKVANEGGEDVLALATASIGRGWTVTSLVAGDDAELVPNRTRAANEVDDTVTGIETSTGISTGLTRCENYNRSEGWYCTMPHGHTGQHAAGNGTRIITVWDQRN